MAKQEEVAFSAENLEISFSDQDILKDASLTIEMVQGNRHFFVY